MPLQPRSRKRRNGNLDPHIWLDPTRVITYVENIRQGLTQLRSQWRGPPINPMPIFFQREAENPRRVGHGAGLSNSLRKKIAGDQSRSARIFCRALWIHNCRDCHRKLQFGCGPFCSPLPALIDQVRSVVRPPFFWTYPITATLPAQIADETGVKRVTDLHLEFDIWRASRTDIEMMKDNVTKIVNLLKYIGPPPR